MFQFPKKKKKCVLIPSVFKKLKTKDYFYELEIMINTVINEFYQNIIKINLITH